ncbi:putative type 11 methyltransferase [Magnetofaba australis IT-1]|uniref:Putative type 11 methyltransferase n=1 Tax=Magnetofaba australis IT-1 TaxID=1434232 RepID=A0A1Y2JYV5_9PROT|nr:putative type 11 methyltransferase [Magnetofaba australis IT-1]
MGADHCRLKPFLPESAQYTGIGLGSDALDLQINLEREPLPYAERSFDTVLCLDVLEHLDNIYDVFDALCRVTDRYLILSLPNAWADFLTVLRDKPYQADGPFKFYGLPPEPPEDRHKWFFSWDEAERFVRVRGEKNGLQVAQIDSYSPHADYRAWDGYGIQGRLRAWARRMTLRPDIPPQNLLNGTLWAVLEKK